MPSLRFHKRVVPWLVLLLVAAPVAVAQAHHVSDGGPTNGLSIPSLTHGQMAVIANYQSAILDLANREPFPDRPFRRLLNFVEIEQFNCLWGLVPASISDEDSPFNECSHARLAGTQALLLHMEKLPGDQRAVQDLVQQIDTAMVMRDAALELCRYSDEPFNTADTITPHWLSVPRHWPSLLFFLALGMVTVGAISATRRVLGHRKTA